MKPRIYVSGPSRDLERCEAAIALCRDLGAEITYDWTEEMRRHNGETTPSDPIVQRTIAEADLGGVASADVVLFLDGPNASPGRWVELGAAWGCQVPIVASVPEGCQAYIWHQLGLVEHAQSDGDACRAAVALAFRRVGERHRDAKYVAQLG